MTLEVFLSNVGSIITAMVSWMGNVLSFVTDNPILYVGLIGIMFVSFTVGIVLRLFRA